MNKILECCIIDCSEYNKTCTGSKSRDPIFECGKIGWNKEEGYIVLPEIKTHKRDIFTDGAQ